MDDWRKNLGGAEAFWRSFGLPRRGEYGGRCSNVLCSHSGADWYNRHSGLYYCEECARRINDSCLKHGERKKMCERHAVDPAYCPLARQG